MHYRVMAVITGLLISATVLAAPPAAPKSASKKDVKITDYLPEVKFTANGKSHTIERIQDEARAAMNELGGVPPAFASSGSSMIPHTPRSPEFITT